MRVLEASGFDYAADRGGDIAEDVQRLPVDFSDFLDCLSRKLRRADVDQCISARRFELDDVRVDGRL
ncbi:hypothetical protein V1293_003577 [Bradyrhizobium sp. AZCC 1693]